MNKPENRYRFVSIFLLSIMMSVVPSSSQTVDQREIAASAKSFLSAWLVNRNVREAMLYVASRPLVSKKCDLLPNANKVPTSGALRRNIIKKNLSLALTVIPKYPSFELAVAPGEIPESDWMEIEQTDSFQIIQLKPGKDGYLMCKFDENSEYHKALIRPGIKYISFKLKNVKDCPDLEDWISAWAKEGKHWRLISINLLED